MPQFTNQPGLGQTPISMHALCRNAKNSGDFVSFQTSEEAHLDHLCLPRIKLRQRQECLVECHQVRIYLARERELFFQRDTGAARPAPRVINQNTPHESRAHCEEMCPVVPLNLPEVDEPDKRLIHQRCRLKGMTRRLVTEAAKGDSM